jgi:nanoRNase/pAp phosphatase (c-di-AMP/oligoRNAs hydrolase)
LKSPFGKSISGAEKAKRLMKVAGAEDRLAILINADPDALASAMALSRMFWRRTKSARIFRINRIDRADNMAFVKLLDIGNSHIRQLKKSEFDKWAIVDSQPSHNKAFDGFEFNIIIDHHPVTSGLKADFIDIREDCGANATVMTEYLKALKITPSPRLATALFYAIKADTSNFVRETVAADMIAFRYLYDFVNLNIIKKIESTEFSRKTLARFKLSIDRLVFFKGVALVHLGDVDNPDTLVMVADFFLKMAEAHWSIVSGVYNKTLIVIFRNAGFRRDAGKLAKAMFGAIGSAGGHKSAARAEVPLERIPDTPDSEECGKFVLRQVRRAFAE